MDRAQVIAFVDFLVGDRLVGVDHDGNEFGTPVCPEARAFIVARLGEKTPSSGYACVSADYHRPSAIALAGLLREVADFLDPVKDPES